MQFLRLKYLSILRFAPVEFSVGQFLHFWGSVQLSPGWLELLRSWMYFCVQEYQGDKDVFFFEDVWVPGVCVLTSLSLVKQSFPFFDVCFSRDVDFHTCYLEIQECFPCFSDKKPSPDPWFHRYPFSSNQWLQPPSPTGWAHRGWRCFAFARAEVPQRRCDAKPPCQGHGWRCRWLGPGWSQEPGLVVFFLCRVLSILSIFEYWFLKKNSQVSMNTWVVKFCHSVLLINFGWSGA